MKLVAREAFRTFRRAPGLSALAVAAIGFSLFTTGLYALVALNFRGALESIAERVEIVAFLMRGTPPETVTLASQDIAAFPEVLEVNYVSAEEALKRAQQELEEFREAYKELSSNPLPASFEIRLKPPYRSAAAVRAVADRLAGFAFVDDVRYGREWVERLDQLRRLASIVQFMIGIAFAIVAMAIIGVTIRITVLQRAPEIAIMRLVGATNNFIRGPFVLEGAIKGVLGGVVALLLCWAGFALFKAALGTDLPDLRFFRPVDMVVIVLFGTLIGLLGSLLSVGRHLKAV